MKKSVLFLALAATVAFTSCSSDDDGDSNSSCNTCTIELEGISSTTEYCDNGDGTMTATTDGVEQNVPLNGISFASFISIIEASGGTCN